jgi:hypothetical protein
MLRWFCRDAPRNSTGASAGAYKAAHLPSTRRRAGLYLGGSRLAVVYFKALFVT